MRKVFIDTGLNDLFLKKGYVVLNLLEPGVCEDLVEAFGTLHQGKEPEVFFTTTHSPDIAYRKACNMLIIASLMPKLKTLFEGYLPLYGNFMVKPPGQYSECSLHQDWSFVDEEKFRSVNVWVAVEDTNLKNGCIHVLEGSHNLPFPPRGRNISRVFEEAVDSMVDNLLVPVPLKKGQAVVFDSAILHYSPKNKSDRTRLAVSLMLYPDDAQLIHYVYDKKVPSHIIRFNVEEEFFIAYSSAADLYMTDAESKDINLDKITYEKIRSMLLGAK